MRSMSIQGFLQDFLPKKSHLKEATLRDGNGMTLGVDFSIQFYQICQKLHLHGLSNQGTHLKEEVVRIHKELTDLGVLPVYVMDGKKNPVKETVVRQDRSKGVSDTEQRLADFFKKGRTKPDTVTQTE